MIFTFQGCNEIYDHEEEKHHHEAIAATDVNVVRTKIYIALRTSGHHRNLEARMNKGSKKKVNVDLPISTSSIFVKIVIYTNTVMYVGFFAQYELLYVKGASMH